MPGPRLPAGSGSRRGARTVAALASERRRARRCVPAAARDSAPPLRACAEEDARRPYIQIRPSVLLSHRAERAPSGATPRPVSLPAPPGPGSAPRLRRRGPPALRARPSPRPRAGSRLRPAFLPSATTSPGASDAHSRARISAAPISTRTTTGTSPTASTSASFSASLTPSSSSCNPVDSCAAPAERLGPRSAARAPSRTTRRPSSPSAARSATRARPARGGRGPRDSRGESAEAPMPPGSQASPRRSVPTSPAVDAARCGDERERRAGHVPEPREASRVHSRSRGAERGGAGDEDARRVGVVVDDHGRDRLDVSPPAV